MKNIKKWYKLTYLQNRESQMQKTSVRLLGRKGGEGINWKTGTDRHVLLYIK